LEKDDDGLAPFSELGSHFVDDIAVILHVSMIPIEARFAQVVWKHRLHPSSRRISLSFDKFRSRIDYILEVLV
jgi:hypothetical protein